MRVSSVSGLMLVFTCLQEQEDEEEEEEDVLDRETVKKLASIAVARETKKLKKRKTKGRCVACMPGNAQHHV